MPKRVHLFLPALLLGFCTLRTSHGAPHRLIVEVPPVDIGSRKHDEMPAKIDIEWKTILADAKLTGKIDFDSIHVIQLGDGGKPLVFGKGADGAPTTDRPFRWYDRDIPDPFPDFQETLSRVDGKITPKPARGVGFLYNTSGRGEQGSLAFIHTQTGNAPARYAITFDLLDAKTPTTSNGPRGWIGDGQLRCSETGASTTGGGHTRIALDDWNDDGLTDIIQGEETGLLFVFINTGSKTQPRFAERSFLTDANGQPIDVGTHAAPLVIDFDGDGIKDLLVGTYQNRICFFKNTGTNKDRKLVYKGVLMIDGKPLELPTNPLGGEASETIFNHDYYPVLEAADSNGDGKIDLLAGGYVTGRIFVLENVGTNADGTMKLRIGEPIPADGQVINVGDWCAAPCAADFNGDGGLDIITGRQPFSKAAAKDETLLKYYQSTGPSHPPTLSEIPLPHEGPMPNGFLATPRAADLNGDGLLDLVVSSRQNIYIYYNIGSKTRPKFATHTQPILLSWGSSDLPGTLFVDYNHDGFVDLFGRYHVFLNMGQAAPIEFSRGQSILQPGLDTISHPSGVGDDWFYPLIYDFDKDGDFDVLFGDWHGTIWFHRNNGSDAKPDYDPVGCRLKLASGQDVKVGPIGGDAAKDFNVLQGARTEFAVDDMDGDGLPDLLVADCYGAIRYFKNIGSLVDPRFAPAIELGSVKSRASVDSIDWNDDGKRDVIAGSAGGTVRVYLNTGSKGAAEFTEGIDPGLAPLRQPRVHVADLNHDGDEDLIVPSLQGTVWIERSFLKHGYAKAKLLSVESAASSPEE